MKRMNLVLVLLVTLLVFSVGQAAQLHVGAGQTYTDLQSAFNATASGDEIVIHEGTYNTGPYAYLYNKTNVNIHAYESSPGVYDKAVVVGAIELIQVDASQVHHLYIQPAGQDTLAGQSYKFGLADYYVSRENYMSYLTFFNGAPDTAAVVAVAQYGMSQYNHFTIYNCDMAIYTGYNSGALLSNSIIADCDAGLAFAHNAGGSNVYYSDITNGYTYSPQSMIYRGEGCIETDPLFASTDPESPYFLWLQPGSDASGTAGPCPQIFSWVQNDNFANMGSQPTIPEPATIALIALGGVLLRRKLN